MKSTFFFFFFFEVGSQHFLKFTCSKNRREMALFLYGALFNEHHIYDRECKRKRNSNMGGLNIFDFICIVPVENYNRVTT